MDQDADDANGNSGKQAFWFAEKNHLQSDLVLSVNLNNTTSRMDVVSTFRLPGEALHLQGMR